METTEVDRHLFLIEVIFGWRALRDSGQEITLSTNSRNRKLAHAHEMPCTNPRMLTVNI